MVVALKKRTWCYVLKPKLFEMSACDCGNHDTTWSEYEDHLWCENCSKDFIPKNKGIFDGPIAAGVAALMGIKFDRINIETKVIEKYNIHAGEYESI